MKEPPKCQWWDIDFDTMKVERCESGKPATFIHCDMPNAPMCEDHRCRCKQPNQTEAPKVECLGNLNSGAYS